MMRILATISVRKSDGTIDPDLDQNTQFSCITRAHVPRYVIGNPLPPLSWVAEFKDAPNKPKKLKSHVAGANKQRSR